MTADDIKYIGIPLNNITELTIIQICSALEWVLNNTNLDFDINDIEQLKALSNGVKLFILKYIEVMSITAGISSESIEGLSQSFSDMDKEKLIRQYAKTFLGECYNKSSLKYVPCHEIWRDY